MKILRSVPVRAAAAAVLLALAGSAAQEAAPANVVAEIAAQIEKARDLLREDGKWAEALNLLAPLLSRLLSVPEAKQRIELSAEVFLLRGIASAGLGDEPAALREFRSLYALSPEVVRAAAKNVFDQKVLPLLRRAERESRGEETGTFLAIVTDPPGATVSINGREIGEAPVLFQASGPGTVAVEVKKAGYQSVKEDMVIGPAGTRRELRLVPVSFSVLARSIPTGARILLDGVDTGKVTEAEIPDLGPGPHRLRLELPGYRGWEGVIEATSENPRAEAETRLLASAYVSEAVWGGLESTLFKSPTAISRGPGNGFVVADASDAVLKVLDDEGRLVGGADPGTIAELGLGGVSGLAVARSGRFLLSDPENHVVYLLNPNGMLSSRWGSFGSGPGEFNTPAGLAVDGEDRVYIADSGNDRVQVRSMEGIPIQTWGGFQNPRGVAVSGDRVYVLDARKVQVFSLAGALQSAWEPKDPEGESLTGATALAVDEDGCVFLADPKSHRILKYDPAGGLVCAWGAPGTEAGELGRPCGLCLDGKGRVFVAENENYRIQIFRVEKQS